MKSLSSVFRPEMSPHAVIFAACLFLLMGAFMLSPPEAEGGHVALGRFSLPHVCTFKNLTGLPCPGCGLTRSMTAAIRGDFSLSWKHHRLGLITTLYIMLQFVLNLLILGVARWRSRLKKIGRRLNGGLPFLAIVFLFNWTAILISLL